MRRRFRIRWLLKWLGVIVCLLIVAGAVVCVRYELAFIQLSQQSVLAIAYGAVFIGDNIIAPPPQSGTILSFQRLFSTPNEVPGYWFRYGLLPTWSGAGRITVPLWIIFLVCALPTIWLWRMDRRRHDSECCAACGYDLTGNVSGRCPECGEATS